MDEAHVVQQLGCVLIVDWTEETDGATELVCNVRINTSSV